MRILVTGAGGQTGKAVIKAFIKKGIDVCAMVHRKSQTEQMAEMGVRRTVVGDMMDPTDLRNALDGAEAAAVIAENLESHTGATYELCGTENLKLDDVLNILHKIYRREITAEYISDREFLNGLTKSGASEYKQDMMIKMFHHYNEHSFIGNAGTLTALLERKPHTLLEFLEETDKINENSRF